MYAHNLLYRNLKALWETKNTIHEMLFHYSLQGCIQLSFNYIFQKMFRFSRLILYYLYIYNIWQDDWPNSSRGSPLLPGYDRIL